MTADEVLEAMAHAAHAASAPPYPWAMLNEKRRENWRDIIRAAIRALPAGWVVAQVPGFILTEECDATEYHDAAGWNRALAAVRASAVEVG